MTSRRLTFLALLLPTLACLAFRVSVISRPFIANAEGTVCAPGLNVARNYARYGFFATRGGGITNTGLVNPDQFVIYAHHPPGVVMGVALVQKLFGVSEWTSRSTTVFFCVATTLLLSLSIGKRFGTPAGFLAGTFYAFCPETIAFGGMPDYINTQLAFFAVATIVAWCRYTETRETQWIVWACLAFAGGLFSDWLILYVAPPIALHFLMITPARRWWRAWPPVVFAAGLLALLLLGAWWADPTESILHQMYVRSIGRPDHETPYTFLSWTRRVLLDHQGRMHTWIVCVSAVIFAISAAFGLRAGGEPSKSRSRVLPILLLGFGVLHLLVGIQGNYQHVWWSALASPGWAACGACGLACVISRIAQFNTAASIASMTVVTLLFFALSIPVAKPVMVDEFYKGEKTYGYTLKDLGRTVRQISAETDGVLTSDFNDPYTNHSEPALWFYADRQLRAGCNDPAQLDNYYLLPGPYQLDYGHWQTSGPAPTWFVLPEAHRGRFPELAKTLDARFPSKVVGKFWVYDLRPR